MATSINLNSKAAELCAEARQHSAELGIAATTLGSGTQILDFGVEATGGVAAGLQLARICLADLADVQLVPANAELWQGSAIQVSTDQPLLACMGSQYAGWQIQGEDFFAMGSGPMRAIAAGEELLQKLGIREQADLAVGILESERLPPEDVCNELAEKLAVAPDRLTLCVAPTKSLSGTIQIVSRSVETALHKLFELGFDLTQVQSGIGTAPLSPVASDFITGIGRTNDAILYGGEVTLFVRSSDELLREIGPRVPSSASNDHGRPFAAIFEQYDRDFYKIDPQLFSPAVITFMNIESGNSFRFGHLVPRVVHESFGVR